MAWQHEQHEMTVMTVMTEVRAGDGVMAKNECTEC
jgi:hypothetical protein